MIDPAGPGKLGLDKLDLTSIEPLLRRALEEDLGTWGDITTDSVIPPETRAHAVMRSRARGVLSGGEAAAAIFRLLDPDTTIDVHLADGSPLERGSGILTIDGDAWGVLGAERTALNCVSHLSGIATATRQMVDIVAGTHARVSCTRKTNLGLRVLEKYAVRCGGGVNHRSGLYDAILVKDNHIAIAGGIRIAATRALAERRTDMQVEIEVDSVQQLQEIIDLPIDAVLLDNMPPDLLRHCVELVDGQFTTEASGGVTTATIRAIAETGVDVISIGWLTHSAPALDIGLDIST
ncbi:MAG TPA: carboxylating nicotinate-nucleotide diphosphorylase [Gemmatimonadales bacterium]|jgi:nicotinate-nucleotide pyrophosphorylase (carboxylating)